MGLEEKQTQYARFKQKNIVTNWAGQLNDISCKFFTLIKFSLNDQLLIVSGFVILLILKLEFVANCQLQQTFKQNILKRPIRTSNLSFAL